MLSSPEKVSTEQTKLIRDLYPVLTLIFLKKMPLWKISLCLPFCLGFEDLYLFNKIALVRTLLPGAGRGVENVHQQEKRGGKNHHQKVSMLLVCPTSNPFSCLQTAWFF